MEENKWIDVNERLPKGFIQVLISNIAHKWVSVGYRYLRKPNHKWVNEFDVEQDFVTHWQPLPSPPSTKEDQTTVKG